MSDKLAAKTFNCANQIEPFHEIVSSPTLRTGNMPAGEILVVIFEVFDQIIERLALSPIVRLALEIAEPRILFLPVNIFNGLHGVFPFPRIGMTHQF